MNIDNVLGLYSNIQLKGVLLTQSKNKQHFQGLC